MYIAPQITTSGLAFYMDAGNKKSLPDITTNLNIYSQNYVTSPYNFSAILSATKGYLAPDGSYTASLMVEDTTLGIHRWYIAPPVTLSSNTLYTFSIYVKSAGRTKGLWFNEWTSGRVGVLYDLALGTISGYTTSAGVLTSSSITSVGNGWYRLSYTCQDSASLAGTIYDLRLADNAGSLTYTGDGVSGVYYWGVQLEANSYPTTYLATNGSITSRNICYDRSENSNTGTLVNGPTFSPDNMGSIAFGGTSSYVTFGTVTNALTSQNTISCFVWFKCSRLSAAEPLVFRTNDYTTGWNLWTSNGILRSTLRPSVSNSNNIYSGNISINTWYQGGFTCDNITIKQYLNGIQVGSSAVSGTLNLNNGDTLKIGGHNIYGVQTTMQGNISNVQIYNRDLSAAEVLQNYNASRTRFGV